MDVLEYMRTVPDGYFDLCIWDPPYSGAGEGSDERVKCGRTGGAWATKYGKSINDWDVAPSQEYFDEVFRVSKNQIIWGANYFSMPPTRCFVVWRKLTISDSFTMAMAEYAWTSFNANAKVFEFAPQGNPNDPRFHPTAKPVALYGWLLNMFGNGGGRIFDPMMGSQASRIAAYKKGYDFYGCEVSKEYFDKGCERFERECLGVHHTKSGKVVVEQSLF